MNPWVNCMASFGERACKTRSRSGETANRPFLRLPVCGELGSEDQRVDVDWDDDEDIVPGCYVLNIGVDGLTFSKI